MASIQPLLCLNGKGHQGYNFVRLRLTEPTNKSHHEHVPLLISGTVSVYGTFKVMDREEQFLCTPLVQRAESTVMAHKGFELATEGMTLNPI